MIKKLAVLVCVLSIAIFSGCTDNKNYSEAEPEVNNPIENGNQATLAEKLLSEMTLREKIYQMFIVTPEQITGVGTAVQAGEATRKGLENYPVGGIIYFASNIQSPSQCTDMIKNTQSFSKIPLFIAVDEEGGIVARLGANPAMGTTKIGNMSEVKSADEAYNVGLTIGGDIKRFGFNLDFAPVADVNSNPANPVIGVRSFGSSPETVGEYVSSAVKGFKDSGVLCTLKHFPGHGDTATDSHHGYAEVKKTMDKLKLNELVPFKAGVNAGADFVMIGHISLPNVTGNGIPATLNKEIIDILKNEVGFTGLVITDSMSMGAITKQYSAGAAAVMAISAGNDIILMPADLNEAVTALENAVKNGTVSEERINQSVLKILNKKIDSGIINDKQ